MQRVTEVISVTLKTYHESLIRMSENMIRISYGLVFIVKSDEKLCLEIQWLIIYNARIYSSRLKKY